MGELEVSPPLPCRGGDLQLVLPPSIMAADGACQKGEQIAWDSCRSISVHALALAGLGCCKFGPVKFLGASVVGRGVHAA